MTGVQTCALPISGDFHYTDFFEIAHDRPDVTRDDRASVRLPGEIIRHRQRRFERAAGQRKRHDAQKQAHQSNFDAKRADLQSVESALEIIKSRDESLKRAYSEAHASGDSDRIAEIVHAMTVNEEQKKDLKKGEKELKRQIEAAERQPVQPVSPPQVDMVEQIAQSVSPRSAAWIREAKDHLKDERSVRKMFRAHEDAVEDGITPDTDEYFAFIEGRLGINRQQQQEVESPMSSSAAPTPRRSSPPPAAPVSKIGRAHV